MRGVGRLALVAGIAAFAAVASLTALSVAVDAQAHPAASIVNPGVGPGSELVAAAGDGDTGSCTASFYWQDQDDRLYLGTTGSCITGPAEATATHGPGANVHPRNVTVEAVTQSCLYRTNASDAEARWCPDGPPEYVELGPVAFARDATEPVNTDVGLVCVPPDLVYQAQATLPLRGGPTGLGDARRGDVVLYDGQGAGFDARPATQQRTATIADLDGGIYTRWFEAVGPTSDGDEGAPVVRVDRANPTLQGGAALGMVTWDLGAAAFAAQTTGSIVEDVDRFRHLDLELVTEIPARSQVADCPDRDAAELAGDGTNGTARNVHVDERIVDVDAPGPGVYRFQLDLPTGNALRSMWTEATTETTLAAALAHPTGSTPPEVTTCRSVPEDWSAGVGVQPADEDGRATLTRSQTQGSLPAGVVDVTVAVSEAMELSLLLDEGGASPAAPLEPVDAEPILERVPVETTTAPPATASAEARAPAQPSTQLFVPVFDPSAAYQGGAFETTATVSADATTCAQDRVSGVSSGTGTGLRYGDADVITRPSPVGPALLVEAGTEPVVEAHHEVTAAVWPGQPVAGQGPVAGYASLPVSSG
jgi:hypothetical protein